MTNPVLATAPISRGNPDVEVLDPDNPDHWVRAGTHVAVWCPACDSHHDFHIVGEDGSHPGDPCWEWDGNEEKPTFEGSMLAHEIPGYRPRCHSYLKAGIWEFLDDCTHEHAGKKMAMVPLPDWLVGDE